LSDGAGRLGLRVLDGHLSVLGDVLSGVRDETMADATLDPCFGATVGGHVRHVLDHVRNFAEGCAGGVIDYEARRRGDGIEHSSAGARSAIRGLRDSLGRVAAWDATVRVRAMVSKDDTPVAVASTLAREMVYVVDHTVHHMAMIRAMLERAGVACPAAFGLAAGTQAANACVR
jgi:uncharacterized damage-inducible protein DinB